MSTEQQHEQVDHNLTNHAPTSDVVLYAFAEIRTAAKGFGHRVVALCPDSREKSLALTNLEQAVMWAIASVARNQGAS